MSHIANRGLLEDATLWVVSPNESGGDIFGPPIAVKCRWEDKTEQYFSTLDRTEHVSNSVVYLDRSASVGDYLFQGVSIDLDPTEVVGAARIHRFDKVPNLRNLLITRKAYL